MGSYVLYVLMQAIVALGCAYAAGTLAIKKRRWTFLLLAVGMYLVLSATLTEIWTDRFDWGTGTLGLYLTLVCAGVLSIGVGLLVREMHDDEEDEGLPPIAMLILLVGVLMAVAIVLGSGSESVVDPVADTMSGLAGGFSNLGPAGIVLALPMVIGAVLIIITGARASLVRGDRRGLWLWMAGILLVLWPLDIEVGRVPMNPALLMFALVLVYFGFQPPKEKEGGREREGAQEEERRGEGPVQTAMDEWLRMVRESEQEMKEGTRDEEEAGTPAEEEGLQRTGT